MKMVWCDKHHRALFVVIHNKSWPVTTSALNHIFSLHRDVENITRFWAIGEFHTRVNFYSPRDAVTAFCKLQERQIYEDCCELDLYFASEFILVAGCMFLAANWISNDLEL